MIKELINFVYMNLINNLKTELLDDFLALNPGSSGPEFLSSSKWQDVIVKDGQEFKVMAVSEKETGDDLQATDLLAVILIIKKSTYFFHYWYSPRSPVINSNLDRDKAKELINFLFLKIKDWDNEALFLKIEPANYDRSFWLNNLKTEGVDKKTSQASFSVKEAISLQPKKTWLLNLNKSEESLLKGMHQKTRYNIRLSARKGVTIEEGGKEDVADFWRLMQTTGNRDNFRIHEKNHYQNLIAGKEDFIKLYFAKLGNRKIAAAIVCFFQGKATYLHGASDNTQRNLMAPHLLQWEIIKEAKSRGCSLYDFYGIDEKKWPGVTRFKLGFGGYDRKYPGAFDIIYRDYVYNIFKVVKKIYRSLRR